MGNQAGGTDCESFEAIELGTDANGRLARIVTRKRGGDTPVVEAYVWRAGKLVAE